MFKVGDRVRIVNADGIEQGDYSSEYKNGDIITIYDITDDGDLNFKQSYVDLFSPISSWEFHCIELVTEEEPKIVDSKTSPVTISITLPSQVLTLTKADYEALKRILSE